MIKFSGIGKNNRMTEHFFVLKRGQEIVGEIISFCSRNSIKSAYFSAIGAVSSVELGFYDIHRKQYRFKKFDEDLEVDSIAGNIAVIDGELVLHAHSTFSDSEMRVIGGHLKSAVVSGTCEVFLVPLRQDLVRKFDGDTGLNLIK